MYTRIEPSILHALLDIYKELNCILDNLQYSDLESVLNCIQNEKILLSTPWIIRFYKTSWFNGEIKN